MIKQKISKVLDGILIESASDLHKLLKVKTFTSKQLAFEHLTAIIPLFESRLGALLFLVSTLLSRGLVHLSLSSIYLHPFLTSLAFFFHFPMPPPPSINTYIVLYYRYYYYYYY
jgi:hypothetical protein